MTIHHLCAGLKKVVVEREREYIENCETQEEIERQERSALWQPGGPLHAMRSLSLFRCQAVADAGPRMVWVILPKREEGSVCSDSIGMASSGKLLV